jgi:hypothetical protein
MKRREKNPKPANDNSKEVYKNTSNELVEVEIEKNFFIKTQSPDRVRLEKWKIGRRNFP